MWQKQVNIWMWIEYDEKIIFHTSFKSYIIIDKYVRNNFSSRKSLVLYNKKKKTLEWYFSMLTSCKIPFNGYISLDVVSNITHCYTNWKY